jgi:hypothetical protein
VADHSNGNQQERQAFPDSSRGTIHGCMRGWYRPGRAGERSSSATGHGSTQSCSRPTKINPETGKPFEISERFTVSMGEKANLRKFLGQWRGKTYTNAEAEEGAPLHKLEGVNALVQIGHNTSEATGKTYANIISIMPLPKGNAQDQGRGLPGPSTGQT